MVEEKIEKALAEIRPLIAMHAGGIELISYDKGVVKVRLLGACQGCHLSSLTLKTGVEELLKDRVSEVSSVEAV